MANVIILQSSVRTLMTRLNGGLSRFSVLKFQNSTERTLVSSVSTLFDTHRDLFNVHDRQINLIIKRMAGHNKWSNIKHIKAAKDNEKSALHNKYSRMIRMAIKDGGNKNDPIVNTKLAYVLEEAKNKNVSKSCIESALKGGLSSKEKLEAYTFEIKGPGKCFFIVETLTDNYTRTKQLVKSCLNKTRSSYAEGVSKSAFNQKGVFIVEDTVTENLDKAVEDAIDAGAEDVSRVEIEDGKSALQFISEPRDFWTVKKRLEDLKYVVKSSSIQYLPVIKQELSDDEISVAERLYDLLENLPDVVNIYDNIQ